MSKRRIAKEDYTVGCVCTSIYDMASVRCMLDELHADLQEQDISDHNSYQLGRIHVHNIILVTLSAEPYRSESVTAIAQDMRRTFPSIKFTLLIGTGWATPSPTQDVRLGDLIVGELKTTPTILSTALNLLKTEHARGPNKIPLFLNKMNEGFPLTKEKYCFPGMSDDEQFLSSGNSQAQVQREPRTDTDPRVHYGKITSDERRVNLDVTFGLFCKKFEDYCFDIEAGGRTFPSLVIQGVREDTDWRRYAAATAAGFAMELLSVM